MSLLSQNKKGENMRGKALKKERKGGAIGWTLLWREEFYHE